MKPNRGPNTSPEPSPSGPAATPASFPGASSRLLNIEDISEHHLQVLHRHYAELAHLAKRDHDLTKSHSIEDANRRHSKKSGAGKVASQ